MKHHHPKPHRRPRRPAAEAHGPAEAHEVAPAPGVALLRDAAQRCIAPNEGKHMGLPLRGGTHCAGDEMHGDATMGDGWQRRAMASNAGDGGRWGR
ncbi:MAG: hypothetical protein HXY37_00255 [Chloroflexi bacterium]|nr:hypothetical protein [Chloroflexota bacterium]